MYKMVIKRGDLSNLMSTRSEYRLRNPGLKFLSSARLLSSAWMRSSAAMVSVVEILSWAKAGRYPMVIRFQERNKNRYLSRFFTLIIGYKILPSGQFMTFKRRLCLICFENSSLPDIAFNLSRSDTTITGSSGAVP